MRAKKNNILVVNIFLQRALKRFKIVDAEIKLKTIIHIQINVVLQSINDCVVFN